MDETLVLQILDEFLSSLEPLDTQGAALLQFLKAKGLATDEELAPFLEQAGNTSSVRWRAARVRLGALISSALKTAEQPAKTQPPTDSTAQTNASHTSNAQTNNNNEGTSAKPTEEASQETAQKKETVQKSETAQKTETNTKKEIPQNEATKPASHSAEPADETEKSNQPKITNSAEEKKEPNPAKPDQAAKDNKDKNKLSDENAKENAA